MNLIQEMKKDLQKNHALYLMILPVAIGFILFHYKPMYGIILAFKKYDLILGYQHSPWAGFDNFILFFKDPYCMRLITNTLLLGIYSLVWGFWPPILLALLINEVPFPRFKKTIQSISYLPHFISMVVVVGMLFELFGTDGIINYMIKQMGGEAVNFFNEAKYFRSLYIGSGIWQGIGWSSILYLAALSGIDSSLYEAAEIDGANRFQKMIHISLSGILPTIIILLILNASHIVNIGFEKVYLMYNPLIYEKADIIQTYVYRRGIVSKDFSYATAIGFLNSCVSFLILYLANRLSRRLGETSLW